MTSIQTQRDINAINPYLTFPEVDIMNMSKDEVNASVGKVYIRQHMLSHKKTLSNFYQSPSNEDRNIKSSGVYPMRHSYFSRTGERNAESPRLLKKQTHES